MLEDLVKLFEPDYKRLDMYTLSYIQDIMQDMMQELEYRAKELAVDEEFYLDPASYLRDFYEEELWNVWSEIENWKEKING